MRDRFPGDLVLHPVALASLSLLIVNDHYLKEHFGGPITGKLSDVAGIVFFPVLMVSTLEVARLLSGRRPRNLATRGLTASVVVTGLVFLLAKTWPPATAFFRLGTGIAEWPAYAVRGLFTRTGLPGLPSAHLVRDHTDLFVLPLLIIPWWIGEQRIRQISAREPSTHP